MAKLKTYNGLSNSRPFPSGGKVYQENYDNSRSDSRLIGLDHNDDLGEVYKSGTEVIENESSPATYKMDVDAIVVDENYLSRSEIPSLVEKYVEALSLGRELPPLTIEKGTNKLIDGIHRYKALLGLRDLYESGKLNKDSLCIKDLSLISVEFVEIPDNLTPRMFSLTFNVGHGCPACEQDKAEAVRDQCTKKPGLSLTELAKISGLTTKKIKKYAGDLIEEFEAEKKALIKKWSAEGKTQAEISTELKKKWPYSKGVSQSVISEVLSEKAPWSKTDNVGSRNSSRKGSTISAADGFERSEIEADPQNLSPEASLQKGNDSSVLAQPSHECGSLENQALTELGSLYGPAAMNELDPSGVDYGVVGHREGLPEFADQKERDIGHNSEIAAMAQPAHSNPYAGKGQLLSGNAAKYDAHSASVDSLNEFRRMQQYQTLVNSGREQRIFERILSLPDPKDKTLEKIEKVLAEAEAEAEERRSMTFV